MKSTYTGKDLDILYYFGDSNQPGFVINAYFISGSTLAIYGFYINDKGEMVVNSTASSVVNGSEIDEYGRLCMAGEYENLTRIDENGNLWFNYDAAEEYIPVGGGSGNRSRYYPLGNGQTLDLMDIIESFNPSPYNGFTYPQCIEGYSLIFRDRVKSITAHFEVVTDEYGSYEMDRTWTNTKTIGFLLEEMKNGLSQIDKTHITSMTCTITDMSQESIDVVSAYPGLVLNFNIYRHLLNLNVHIDMPEDNGVLKGGLCLSTGSLKIDDSDKYLYELMIKYEFRGIYGLVGRKFNDIFTDPEGHLIFEDGYWYHDDVDDPYFTMDETGHLILNDDVLEDYINVQNGHMYIDFDLATSNLISNRKQLIEVYLGGNNLLYKLQVSDFKYDDDNYRVSIKMEDILNRLQEVMIDSLSGYISSGGRMSWHELLDDEFSSFLKDNSIYFPLYVSEERPPELDIRRIYRDYLDNDDHPLVKNVTAYDFLNNVLSQFGQVGYIKTIDSTKSTGWVNIDAFDFGIIIKPAINTAGQVDRLLGYDSQHDYRPFSLVDGKPYVIDSSFILGKITRSIIKPNHITKVIGTYYIYNYDEDEFDNSYETSYSVGTGKFTYNNDCNTYLVYDNYNSNNIGDMYFDVSTQVLKPFYQYIAEVMIGKYVFGLDELSFNAILSRDYGSADAASLISFSLGERFQIDFSNTIIPTNYAYQITSTSLSYDGELKWDIVGLQV